MEENKGYETVLANELVSDYMMEYIDAVITARAIPNLYDGLKPIERRILYTMHSHGYSSNKVHVKSARITGLVMSDFHPHS